MTNIDEGMRSLNAACRAAVEPMALAPDDGVEDALASTRSVVHDLLAGADPAQAETIATHLAVILGAVLSDYADASGEQRATVIGDYLPT